MKLTLLCPPAKIHRIAYIQALLSQFFWTLVLDLT